MLLRNIDSVLKWLLPVICDDKQLKIIIFSVTKDLVSLIGKPSFRQFTTVSLCDKVLYSLKGMVALLTKITVHIKFGILINNTLIKNSKNIPNFFKLQICDFF